MRRLSWKGNRREREEERKVVEGSGGRVVKRERASERGERDIFDRKTLTL